MGSWFGGGKKKPQKQAQAPVATAPPPEVKNNAGVLMGLPPENKDTYLSSNATAALSRQRFLGY